MGLNYTRACLVGALLLAAGAPGHCFDSEHASNRSTARAASVNNTWTRVGTSGGMSIYEEGSLKGPGGRTVPARLEYRLTTRQVGVAAGRAASRLWFPAAAGMLIWDWYDDARIKPDPLNPGEYVRDPGGAPVSGTDWRYGLTTTTLVDVSPVAAANRLFPISCSAPFSCGPWTVQSEALGRCLAPTDTECAVVTMQRSYSSAGSGSGTVTQLIQGARVVTAPTCPAVVDPLDPALSIPAHPPMADGKCRTGRYTVDLTAEDAYDYRDGWTGGRAVTWDDIMNDVLGRAGPGGIPTTNDWDKIVTNFPPSLSGGTESTTGTDGRITERAVGWDLARDPLRKDEVKFSPTTTTTVKNPDGSIAEGPTKTTDPSAAGDRATDPCVDDPGRLGCIGLGEVKNQNLVEKDISVSVTPQPGWGSDTGACPAPRTFNAGGQVVTIDNTLFCDFFSGIRFVVLGMAFLGAGFIVMGGTKS